MIFDLSKCVTAPCAQSLRGVVACASAMIWAVAGSSSVTIAAPKPSQENAVSVAASGPLVAVVSLAAQRLSVYDKNGRVLTSRVSSGQKGFETPLGVFAIIERNREHFSNLYDDAAMPNMQRITWSGVAMHAGHLPGYPASHGCIRLPMDVSARLFELTKLGTRVIVAEGDVAPMAFDHPRLFNVRPSESPALANAVWPTKRDDGMSLPMMLGAAVITPAKASVETNDLPVTVDPFADRPAGTSRAAWAAELLSRAQKADAAARSAKAGALAARKSADRAMIQLLNVERARFATAAKIEAIAAGASRARNASAIAKMEASMAVAEARMTRLLVEIDQLRGIEERKRVEAEKLEKAAEAAASLKVATGTLARDANRSLKPVSVFVSRKSGRLYVRQGFEPVFDVPVAILDDASPIGTHVFTALEVRADTGSMQWSAVTAVGAVIHQVEETPPGRRAKPQAPVTVDPSLTAAAALDRIDIPEHVRQRIGEMLMPGSSLIVSDQPVSVETGKGTDFVILTK
jgi:L,D-transpeptidase catalytic domain